MAADDTYLSILDQRFELETETIEDGFESSIARHEFPYRDGALLEDMGQKARTVRIRCYFLNENYDAHKDLINYLGYSDDLHELQHLRYGLIQGKIESIVVRHDDREKTAEIDLTFVENLRGTIEPEPATSVAADVEEAFVAGQAELTAEIERDIEEQLGTDAAGILDTAVDLGSGLYEQFGGLTREAHAYVRAADTYVKSLNAKLTGVTNPANGLIAVIDYAANLPGYVARSIAGTVERYAILAAASSAFPERLVDNFHNGVDDICAAPDTYRKYARISAAQRSAHLAATIFKEDKDTGSRQKQAQATASFSSLGRRLSRQETGEILTINEMEQILSAVRTRLQEAISLSRNMPSLKNLAEALTDHVRQMKLERPKVIAVEVHNSLPLHLVCLKYGLTTSDAEQLMSINAIRHPNYVSGEVNVYAG